MSLDKTLTDTYRRDLKLDRYEVYGALPAHFDDNHTKLVNFLQKYYESLEDPNNPVSSIKDIMSVRDITQTKEEFLPNISSELLLGKPYFESFTDKRSALQFSSLLYRSKGTEFSIKQFFRVFFSVDIEVIYGDDATFSIGAPNEETLEYIGSTQEETHFDFTFANGTIDVLFGDDQVMMTQGEHYEVLYDSKQVVLLEHDDADFDTREGFLPEGVKILIKTDVPDSSAIGSEVTSRKITDDGFYQRYGIEINTPLSVKLWREAYKTFVHPAGMFLSSQVTLSSVYEFGEQTPLPPWWNSSKLGSMPDAIIQPPPPIVLETSAPVMLAQGGLGLHTTSYAEISNGPDGYKILSRVNDQQLPYKVEGWHTQYSSMSAADDINARTLDDTYADMSNTINLIDEDVWHYDYLHPVDSDGAGNRTPIYGYND